jgi:hypothetical protein
MKHVLFIACAAFAVCALPVRALAQPTHADSPKATIIVTQELVVGTTILQPGEYKFQCRTFDQKTFLVVTSTETGKEIVRVPCVREMLDAAVTDSDFRSIARQDGKKKLTSVRIKGEAVAHRVVD